MHNFRIIWGVCSTPSSSTQRQRNIQEEQFCSTRPRQTHMRSSVSIQLKQNLPADAVASFRRGVELSPNEPTFHTAYGIVLALNGDCTDAISQFEAALALDPHESIAGLQHVLHCRASGHLCAGLRE